MMNSILFSPVKEGLYGLSEEKVTMSAFDVQRLREEASISAKLKQELGHLKIDSEYQEKVNRIESKKELNEMKCENARLQIKNAMLSDENASLRESLDAANMAVAKSIAKQSVSSTRNRLSGSPLSRHNQSSPSTNDTIAMSQEIFEFRLNSMRVQKEIMEQQRNRVVAELTQLVNTSTSREQEVAALRRKITKLENIIHDLEETQAKTSRSQSKEAKTLENSLKQAEARAYSLDQNLSKSERELKQLRIALQQEQGLRQRVEDELNRRANVGEEMNSRSLEWKLEKSSLEEKLERFEMRAQQAELSLNKRESKLEQIERENGELREKLDAAISSRAQLKLKFKDAKERVDSEIDQMISSSDKTIAQLKKEHEAELARVKKAYEEALKNRTHESTERAIMEARSTAEMATKQLERTTQEALRAAKDAAEAAAARALKEAQDREEKVRVQVEKERLKIEKEKEKAEKAREKAEQKADRERERASKEKAQKEALVAEAARKELELKTRLKHAKETEKLLEKVVNKTTKASRNASSAVAKADSTLDEIDRALAASRKATDPSLASYITSLKLSSTNENSESVDDVQNSFENKETFKDDLKTSSSISSDHENSDSVNLIPQQISSAILGEKRPVSQAGLSTPISNHKSIKIGSISGIKPLPSVAGRPPLSATPLASFISKAKSFTNGSIQPISSVGIGGLGPARTKSIVPKLKRGVNR